MFGSAATLDAQNEFNDGSNGVKAATGTGGFRLLAGQGGCLDISGTWVGTLTLRRSFDDGATWRTVALYTANASINIESPVECHYDVGFATGNYTSGSAVTEFNRQK